MTEGNYISKIKIKRSNLIFFPLAFRIVSCLLLPESSKFYIIRDLLLNDYLTNIAVVTIPFLMMQSPPNCDLQGLRTTSL